MAGAINYAASRSTDEITAGSILLIRGGSILVSAKDWILPPENMGSEIGLIVQNHGRIPMATQAANQACQKPISLRLRDSLTKCGFAFPY